MKTCLVCGERFEDAYLYCWEDGTRLDLGKSAVVDPDTGTTSAISTERELLQTHRSATARGMYCQGCQRTYPATFTFCPVDFLPLTQAKAPPVQTTAVDGTVETSASPDYNKAADPQEETIELEIPEETTEACEANQHSESPLSSSEASIVEYSEQGRRLWLGTDLPSLGWRGKRTSNNNGATESQVVGNDSRMQLAARATAALLVVFAVAAAYVIYSLATRGPDRSAQNATWTTGSLQTQEQPLIPTPREARDYTEESQAPELPELNDVTSDLSMPGSGYSRVPNRTTADRRDSQTIPATRIPANVGGSLTDSRSLTTGRFASNLVRMRARRSASGYSYELTFTIREQAGRPMRWERLSIFTRSDGGATHSESVPFPYLLSGAGSLTFTVNVQMPGYSESDWRGRITLMSVGADDDGRPLRASLAANVAP